LPENFLSHSDLIDHVAQLVSAVQLTSFSSQPPWCLYEGVTCGDVAGITSYGIIQSISLTNLGLTGSLPDSIGDFRRLTFFDISSNNIHGNIPDTVINWHDGITSLSLNANNLTGTIPPAIGHLVHLTALHLHDNNLEGSIPSVVGSLNSLSVLTLGGNSLTGKIPSTIRDMAALQHISLNSNMLEGTIPAQISTLSRLVFFDVADNFLSMGSAIMLSETVFSAAMSSGTLKLSGNRLAYQSMAHPEQNCIATGCFQAAPGTAGEFSPSHS
jgi:Leucine-rich repeat (LRR) protein